MRRRIPSEFVLRPLLYQIVSQTIIARGGFGRWYLLVCPMLDGCLFIGCIAQVFTIPDAILALGY
jgi:hypothetical protein